MRFSKEELEVFKQKLIEKRNALTHHMQQANTALTEHDESNAHSQHQAEGGSDEANLGTSMTLSESDKKMIKQIDRALEKMDDGTYGMCDLSGEEIPLKRLEVMPWATMTVASQEQVEKGLI